jgi:hypothetical protein
MKTELVDMGKATAELRVGSLLKYLNQREKKFKGISSRIPIDEAALLDRAVRGTESSILNRIASDPKHRGHKGVLDRYGDAVIGKFEEQLQIGLLTRKPWAEMRADLTEQSPFLKGAPAHWAERIVRTELMGASNMAGLEVVRGAQDELGDMVKILVATFDDRTGADSYAVHGQIRRPSEAFDSWFGSYQHPPNRPNDREIVIPHRMSWPIESEFEPVSDSQVASRWAAEGRKGSPPRRPKLSTEDRKLFGKELTPGQLAPIPSPMTQATAPQAKQQGPMAGEPFAGFQHAAGKARETGKTVYASASKTMMGGNMQQVPKLAYSPWKSGGQWIVLPNGSWSFES